MSISLDSCLYLLFYKNLNSWNYSVNFADAFACCTAETATEATVVVVVDWCSRGCSTTLSEEGENVNETTRRTADCCCREVLPLSRDNSAPPTSAECFVLLPSHFFDFTDKFLDVFFFVRVDEDDEAGSLFYENEGYIEWTTNVFTLYI